MSIGSPDNEERRLIAEYETVTRFYYWAISELSRQEWNVAVRYVVLAVVVVVVAIVAAIFWYFGIRKGCRIDPVM